MAAGALAMSGRERERLVVIAQVCGRVVGQGGAAEQLGICVRQVKRLVRAYRAEGDAGLVSRQRGRASNRRLAPGVGERASELLGGKYRDFGPTLACEKLAELEGILVSRETIRRLQIRHGLWKPKRRRHKRVFQLRERRPRFGELIQIDGSPHDQAKFFGGNAHLSRQLQHPLRVDGPGQLLRRGLSRHAVEAEFHTRGCPRAVLSWDDFLDDRRGALERISKQLHLSWPRWNDEALAEIDAFVTTDLRHQSISVEELAASSRGQRRGPQRLRRLCEPDRGSCEQKSPTPAGEVYCRV